MAQNEELRIVRGNAFNIKIQVEAIRLDGTKVDNFNLTEANPQLKVWHAGQKTAKEFVIDGNSAIISFAGTELLGWYGLEMSGTFESAPWRFAVVQVFQIVETNEKANVPAWTFLTDDTYFVEGVLTLYANGATHQADWDETNPTSPSYIKNKPAVVSPTQLQQAVNAEKERAEAAEQANADAIAEKYTKPSGGIPSTDMTEAVQTSLQKADNAAPQSEVDGIESKIPAAASAQNQLADKNFVNSSIATSTATYRGSYNVVSDLSLPADATHAQIEASIATKLTALGIVADNNDYCFVQIPTATATPTEIASIERYKFNGNAWAYEYTLNNSGFTADQWAAINSGITSGAVVKLEALPTNAELTTLLNGKASDTVFTGAGAATAGTKGLVPAPAAGDNNKYLRGDGTWSDDLPRAAIVDNTLVFYTGGTIIGNTLVIG